MSDNTETATSPAPSHLVDRSFPFCDRPGTDGTELTFDIVYTPTNSVICSFPYWEAEQESRRAARQLVQALNEFCRQGGFVYTPAWNRVGLMIDGSRIFHEEAGQP